ncbi:MAG: hypothetical protein ACOXZ4_07855 [Sphaerochaetaceae bacterium]
MKHQSLQISLTVKELEKLVHPENAQAKEIRRANILLCVDESEGRIRMKSIEVVRRLGTTAQPI